VSFTYRRTVVYQRSPVSFPPGPQYCADCPVVHGQCPGWPNGAAVRQTWHLGVMRCAVGGGQNHRIPRPLRIAIAAGFTGHRVFKP
jgi:hypothetical protein